MPAQIHIFVNGRIFHVEDGVSDFMSGSEIATLAGISADEAFVLRDIKINPKDLRVDTYQPSKSVQQTANANYAAVRITHLPTSIVVSSHEGRSQIRNRAEATRLLRERLIELGHAEPYPVGMNERVRIENDDSFLVTTLPQSR